MPLCRVEACSEDASVEGTAARANVVAETNACERKPAVKEAEEEEEAEEARVEKTHFVPWWGWRR